MSRDNSDRGHSPWHAGSIAVWFGIACILLGAALLLHTMRVIRVDNWWALFILIPALASFASAVHNFRKNGNRFSNSIADSISGGLFFAALGMMFLLRANWAHYWPVFIVIAGISVLLGAVARRR